MIGAAKVRGIPAWVGFLIGVGVAGSPGLARGAEGRRTATALGDVAPPDATTECPKVEGKQIGAPVLNLGQAVDKFNAALEASLSPRSIQILNADPAARDPRAATAVAANAILNKRPVAAAAYLLRAHQAAPKNPDVLVNLAAVSNYFARHDEALAFVTAAAALDRPPVGTAGVNGRAILQTVRGGALLGLDRAKEAEAALREAIALQPDLSEAYSNMAFALGEQGRCQEGVRYLVAGRYSDPRGILEPDTGSSDKGTGKPPGASPPAPRPESIRDDDGGGHCPPSAVAVDLARGQAATLPRFPVATQLEQVLPYWEGVQRHHELASRAHKAFLAEGTVATAQLKQLGKRESAWEDGTVAQRLTVQRSRNLRHLVYCYTSNNFARTDDLRLWRLKRMAGDSLKDFGRKSEPAMLRVGEAERIAMDAAFKERGACSELKSQRAIDACSERVDWKLYNAYCKAWGAYLLDVAPSVRAWDQAHRSYFMEAYKASSAAVSYLSAPESKAYTRWEVKGLELEQYGILIAISDMALSPLARDGDKLQKMIRYCAMPEPSKVDDAAASPDNPLRFCDLAQKSKVKVSAKFAEVAVGCDDVGVELSAGEGIEAFVSVEVDRSEATRKKSEAAARAARVAAGKKDGSNPLGLEDMDNPDPVFTGRVTVMVGAKGGVGNAEAKGGVFVTADGQGNVTNGGVRGEVTVTEGAIAHDVGIGVERQLVESEISFVSTPGEKD